MRYGYSGALAGAALVLAAWPAAAHVTLENDQAPAGATYKAVLQIGHGCGEKATRSLRIEIPEGVYDVKPMPKQGWELETQAGDYARPFDLHGTQLTRGVRRITWSGGELPDAWFDEFTFRAVIGPELAPGSTIHFPTVQECDGAAQRWIDVTGAEGVANPAPALRITAPEPAAHAHMHHQAIAVTQPFARATPPGAKVAGGFMTLTNDGAQDDRLVSITTPAAGRVEMHQMVMQDDVMRMRPLPDGIPVPAGRTVLLQPGGDHLMMMDLAAPLKQGDSVPLTLVFEHAGAVQATLPVLAIDAKGGEHAH